MYNRLTKWSVAISLFLFVPQLPIPSFSQAQQPTGGNKPNPIEDAQDLGELSVDELKSRRASVEDSGDLAEPVKKNILRFLDKSIRFREKEQQLRNSNEEVAQMVATASDRIKVIEDELDRRPPEEHSAAGKIAKMTPAEIEQQLRQVEADLASAKLNLNNWSLTDKILRITIHVGVAYGSDIALAEELLLKIAKENPEVLSEPEPSALFLGFGDNSLNFELRVFIDEPMKRFKISHQLHRAIDDEFRRAGIVIAFPQRDVHLDQIGPLEVNVVSHQVDRAAKPKAASNKN